MPIYQLTRFTCLAIITLLATIACGSPTANLSTIGSTQLKTSWQPNLSLPLGTLLIAQDIDVDVSADCHSHYELLKAQCDVEVQRILASTLRVEFDRGRIFHDEIGYINLSGNGHGTVMNGRYFVTHWHYSTHRHNMFPKGTFDEDANFRLYRADGTLLVELKHAPLTIARVYGETLVLDFGLHNGAGFFDAFGIPSAAFSVNGGDGILPNQTIARINWSESTTFVEWVKVLAVTSDAGVATIKTDGLLVIGASGGGLYLDGQHIANNWKNVGGGDAETGKVTSGFSVAALNMP